MSLSCLILAMLRFNFCFVSTVFLTIISLPLSAESLPKNFDLDFKLEYLEGKYILIGKKPDSQETFTGTVTLKRNKDHLEVTRVVNGHTLHGVATFHAISPDQLVVLTMRFLGESSNLAGTYLYSNDTNNYPRLTGYFGETNKNEKMSGLEALFPVASM